MSTLAVVIAVVAFLWLGIEFSVNQSNTTLGVVCLGVALFFFAAGIFELLDELGGGGGGGDDDDEG